MSTAIEERDYEAITTNFAYIREVTDFYFYFQAQEGQDNLLHYAARDNDIVLATAIYDTWLRIFASNLDTEMMASRESRIQIMIALCPMWGSIVDGCNAQGWTALHCAASHGHKDMVEWLLMRYAAREAVTKVCAPL